MAQQPIGWADRPPHQFAAAIRAKTAEHALGAAAAERAFIRTDPGLDGIGRQVAIAAFAIGSQFEHWRIRWSRRRILREKVANGERLSL